MRLARLAPLMLALLAPPVLAQPAERAVGTKLADGQAYVTLVRLSHQPNPADNGRILIRKTQFDHRLLDERLQPSGRDDHFVCHGFLVVKQ